MAALCGCFTVERSHWRLQELAREMNWDPATTHRFLKALTEARMLDENSDGSYSIGVLPVELSAVYFSDEPRRKEMVSKCEQIADRTGLTCQLGLLREDQMVIVTSYEGKSALKAAAMLGERLPLHATAGGKAILTQLSDAEIETLLPKRLERFTDRTLTSRDVLIKEVRGAREDGITRAGGELAPALHAIGVPLPAATFDTRPAALMCAGPEEHGDGRQWAAAEAMLREI